MPRRTLRYQTRTSRRARGRQPAPHGVARKPGKGTRGGAGRGGGRDGRETLPPPGPALASPPAAEKPADGDAATPLAFPLGAAHLALRRSSGDPAGRRPAGAAPRFPSVSRTSLPATWPRDGGRSEASSPPPVPGEPTSKPGSSSIPPQHTLARPKAGPAHGRRSPRGWPRPATAAGGHTR